MTQPATPGDVISRAASRLTAQREATRTLAKEVAAQRQGTTSPDEVPAPEGSR